MDKRLFGAFSHEKYVELRTGYCDECKDLKFKKCVVISDGIDHWNVPNKVWSLCKTCFDILHMNIMVKFIEMERNERAA